MEHNQITVAANVAAPIETVWQCWTTASDIQKWCNASEDWHTPQATNDLRTGGKFLTRTEAKDGSMGFDFEGTYTEVTPNQKIAYEMPDGRKVTVHFEAQGDTTQIIETFDPENLNPVDMQKAGWQSILDNFKKYTEAN